MDWLSAAVLALAAIPAGLFVVNLILYRRLPLPAICEVPPVSVLIPARDEEQSIGAALASVLASRGVDLELLVLDDHSRDNTAAIVRAAAASDSRVRLLEAPPLPAGWCGKQHACAVLARHAARGVLCFMDADVRLAPDGLARMAGALRARRASLLSGIPRQETETLLERLLLPLIHFVLLGFLPMWWMRFTTRPSFAAGCGQLMVADRDAYEGAGGHAAVRATLHDGLMLPKAFRRAGYRTDLFDATDVAVCRMYRTAGEVWHGLAKNATEGLAHAARIVPFTLILLGGQVLPFALLAAGAGSGVVAAAAALALAPRFAGAALFRQSFTSALVHPVGILILLAIQWYALARSLRGRPAAWKGRAYVSPGRA